MNVASGLLLSLDGSEGASGGAVLSNLGGAVGLPQVLEAPRPILVAEACLAFRDRPCKI